MKEAIPIENRVLVFARGALGDVLLSLAFLSVLPAVFEAEGLTLVGNPSTLRLLEPLPFTAEIRDQNRAEWAGLYAMKPDVHPELAGFIKSHRAGVVLAPKPEDPAADGLRAIGLAPVIIAPSRPPSDRVEHLSDHQFRITGISPPPKEPVITPPDKWMQMGLAVPETHHLRGDSFISLHPGSGGRGKNWDLANWLELADRVERDLSIEPLFLTGPAEGDLAEEIKRLRPGTAVASGLPLPALAALISQGRGYVGHDSGVTHLAARLGMPTLAIFGPTEPAHWSPRGPNAWHIEDASGFGPDRQWKWPEPDAVFVRIKKMLSIDTSSR